MELMLSDFLEESIKAAQDARIDIEPRGWVQYTTSGNKIDCFCPFYCALWFCTGKPEYLPEPDENPQTGQPLKFMVQTLEVIVLPELEKCCTNVVPPDKLVALIQNFDNSLNNWTPEDLIAAIRKEEQTRS